MQKPVGLGPGWALVNGLPWFRIVRDRVFTGGSAVCKRVSSAVALLGLGFLFVPPVGADTITPLFFDGFEADVPEKLDASLAFWWTMSGSVDTLGAGNLCGPAGGSSQCIDLDGTGSKAGTIQTKQTFAVSPAIYRLSFDLAGANRRWKGSQTNTVTVSFGGYYSEDFTLLQYDPFQTFTRDIMVPSAGAANIVFAHHGADWIGLLLDNVSLSHVIVDVPNEDNLISTPEPATWTLLGAALGLLALRSRWKRA